MDKLSDVDLRNYIEINKEILQCKERLYLLERTQATVKEMLKRTYNLCDKDTFNIQDGKINRFVADDGK